jgi:hypothetical protein
MAIASTILEGAATVAASGGTNVTLSSLGVQNGRNTLIFSTDVGALAQRVAEFNAKLAAPNASSLGGYSQSRREVLLKFPKVRADLLRTVNTLRITGGFDIETTDAEIESYCEQAAQMLATANFLPYWKTGSLL